MEEMMDRGMGEGEEMEGNGVSGGLDESFDVSELSSSTAMIHSRLEELQSANPWDRLPGEPNGDYELFLRYMLMGPERSMKKLNREDLVKEGKILPGEPSPHYPTRWIRLRSQWDWQNRVNAWDHRNWDKLVSTQQEAVTREIQDMVEEHIEGLRVFRRSAILGIYARDEDGKVILDEDGNPMIKIPEDENVAWRMFRQAIAAERTASGMPTNISVMTNQQLEQRILEIRQELTPGELDIIDGEYTEERKIDTDQEDDFDTYDDEDDDIDDDE